MSSAAFPAGSGPRTGSPGGELAGLVRDQAHDLRLLASQHSLPEASLRGRTARVIAVTSGKGGVGKTTFAANMAVLLARWGKQVILLDCDLGTANVDVLLGLRPRYSLQHVLSRQRRLDEVIVTGPGGVRVVPGGSGLEELANLSSARCEELLHAFAALDGEADVMLLDTGAGISENVLRFVVAAGEAIVVTTPEPTAMADAYALIKLAHRRMALLDEESGGEAPFLRVVVNQATSEREGRETAQAIVTVAQRFLQAPIESLGWIPSDPSVARAVRAQLPVVDAYPRSPAALALARLARQLQLERGESLQNGSRVAMAPAWPAQPASMRDGTSRLAGPPRSVSPNGAGSTGSSPGSESFRRSERLPSAGSSGRSERLPSAGSSGQAERAPVGPGTARVGGIGQFLQRVLSFSRKPREA
jgi:flagellar biosynthesis protein FlhG